jgi:cytochrome c oxidase subunit 2
VIAQPRADFEAWRRSQVEAAMPPASQAQAGEERFKARCGACHTVRGSGVGGRVGPDLTHLMSRRTLAAATLPNTPDTLARWITHAQDMKPRGLMPNISLGEDEHAAITAYLQTLE